MPSGEVMRKGDGQMRGEHVHVRLADGVDHGGFTPVQQVP